MGRGAAFFRIWMQQKGTNGASWLYFARVLCYAEGRKVGIVMWAKIGRYRPAQRRGKSTSDGFTNSACTVVVLVGVAVAAVRLRRLRRQERKAQRQDTL